jgi:PRTRC genetic system protein C
MALQVNVAKRKFTIQVDSKKIDLPDPNPKMSIQEVINHYSGEYPQLITASVSGPKMKDDAAVYEFKSVIGTKG